VIVPGLRLDSVGEFLPSFDTKAKPREKTALPRPFAWLNK